MNYKIALIRGDGIGPEVVGEAVKVMETVGAKFGHSFEFTDVMMGGCAIDAVGKSYPEGTAEKCRACDAVLLGCGLGRDWQTDTLVQDLLNMEKPLVLDADGLNAISENAELLQKRPAVTVLTPHEGEFLRLGGDLSRGREAAAAAFSQKYGVYLILKGHRTLIADPEGRLAVNNTGNCGMAKGGSGDVLAGMLLSLLGQGCETFDACCAAVWLHGRAGDLAAADKGERSMTPTDLLEQIPYALKNI